MTAEKIKQNYYRAALQLLRFIEQRTPTNRRFGAQADAAWKQFCGALKTTDRIQLMIADAHAQWPGSLGPSTVCNVPAVAADDAFGPDWEPLSGIEAEGLWRDLETSKAATDLHAALTAVAGVWGVELEACVPPDVRPGQSVVVAGPSAVAALIEYFASHRDLEWWRQVTVVATPPGHRQIAAAAGTLLNFNELSVVQVADDTLRKKPVHVVVSSDASEQDAARARSTAG